MDFEIFVEVVKLILWFAILLFPAMYLINAIRKRIEITSKTREVMVIFFMSLLVSMSIYPFLAGLMQYAVDLEAGGETGIGLLLFDSDIATYLIILLIIFLVYIIAFNKTKE